MPVDIAPIPYITDDAIQFPIPYIHIFNFVCQLSLNIFTILILIVKENHVILYYLQIRICYCGSTTENKSSGIPCDIW